MVFKRLQSLSRPKQRTRPPIDVISVGESLKSEDCFVIEIPQAASDNATKDSVFLAFSHSMGAQSNGRDSATSVSSVTTNSGSTRTMRSRSMNEYTRKEKQKEKRQPFFDTNSIALTMCAGRQNPDQELPTPPVMKQRGDDSTLSTILSCLPQCCCDAGSVQGGPGAKGVSSFPDDHSDIVLVDQMDDDTIDPMIGYMESNNQEGVMNKKQQKKDKKFLGVFRRSRTGNTRKTKTK